MIDAVVSVVTNVELDHVEILGPTRAHIAREKAGIIKAGRDGRRRRNRPGDRGESSKRRPNGRVPRRFGDEMSNSPASALASPTAVGCSTCGRRRLAIPRSSFPLFGAHQGLNASVALAAAEAFFGAPLEEDVVAEAFAEVTVPGRLEVVSRQPLVVLDGAHNPAGATVLGDALREDFAGAKNVVVVMGCLRGRDPIELLNAIGPARITHVVATEPASPRAQAAKIVADAAIALGYEVTTFEDVGEAIRAAQDLAGDEDLVVVTGSLYVVGAARAFFRRLGSLRP